MSPFIMTAKAHLQTPLLLLLCLTSSYFCYTNISEQAAHFSAVHKVDYVLALFHNSKTHAKRTKTIKAVLDLLDKSDAVKDKGVLVEYVDVAKTPFFDGHYDLAGEDALKLFVRNQIVNLSDFGGLVESKSADGETEQFLARKIADFVQTAIDGISVELTSMDQFKQLLKDKRVLGLYTGGKGRGFKRHMHVARKNIDFTFAHVFDAPLIAALAIELNGAVTPGVDTFSIVRHVDALTDVDSQVAVSTTSLDDKNLSEFLAFERHPKLSGVETGHDIVKRMFFGAQPLLLYVQSPDSDSRLATFVETVKSLPKRFIYATCLPDAESSGPYLQLFMMAQQMMTPGQVYALHVTPARSVVVESYNKEFMKQGIMDFVFGYHERIKGAIESMRAHLYDKEVEVDDGVVGEEL